jgi:hypothetical protein
MDDLRWLINAGWQVTIGGGEKDGIGCISVTLDDDPSGVSFWGGFDEALAKARAYSEQQEVTP